ncbi:hypothetical protein QFZ77_005875 [Paenibacillus sp. V4I3]|uniref:heparinase II/III family protein n=1 Tax=Paenibacillus sp. V4I3 TaxID=3042305 RepID=UPI00277DBE6A|nr:heparinase II/III family protein [Paenibacillus sp. V4I3]MDQ0877216.1 hypothetical protein [Paenibacillus sp. V4I3]
MNSRLLLEALQAAEAEHASLFEEVRTRSVDIRSGMDNPLLAAHRIEIRQLADQFLTQPIEALPFSAFRLFQVNGSRKEFEKLYFDRRRRLAAFAIAALTEDDAAFIPALEDIIWAICDEYTWCLPAHLDVQDPKAEDEAPRHVDLFASETGHALSEICHLFKDRLDPLIVKRARHEVMQRVLNPYMQLKQVFGWETATNNWSAVCAGSIGMAAIYMIQDSRILMPVLNRVFEAMECFLEGFTEEGACLEGLGYWYYGFGYYVYFAELLKQRTGGQVDLLLDEKKAQRIAEFPQFCFLQENHVANFSDCSRTSGIQTGLFSRLCQRIEQLRIPSLTYRSNSIDHCGRFATALRDLAWTDYALLEKREGLPLHSEFLQEAEWMVSRCQVGGKLISFAAKGGHNAEPHNHNDIGHFVWVVDGVRWLEDLGAGLYTRQYFGDERYSILCNSSSGHSVPIINGCFQSEGEQYRSQVVEVGIQDGRDRFLLDLQQAYDVPHLHKLERLFDLDKQQGKLTITDSYEFTEFPTSITERFISLYPPEVGKEGEIILSASEGQKLRLVYEARLLDATIQTAEHLDHSGNSETVYLIDLKSVDTARQQVISVTLEPVF